MNIEVFRLTLIVTLLVQLIIARTEDSRQNVNNVLANVDINTVIREAVQKELNKYGIVSIANRHNDGLTQSSSKTNCINDENVNRCRTTHEVAGNSKTDLNRSVRDGCPDSSVVARHNQIESEIDNCHTIHEKFFGFPPEHRAIYAHKNYIYAVASDQLCQSALSQNQEFEYFCALFT